jgi:hypothetical protein
MNLGEKSLDKRSFNGTSWCIYSITFYVLIELNEDRKHKQLVIKVHKKSLLQSYSIILSRFSSKSWEFMRNGSYKLFFLHNIYCLHYLICIIFYLSNTCCNYQIEVIFKERIVRKHSYSLI